MKSMKRIFTLIMALACMGMTVFAQAPTKINYQVVARDADNAVLQEQPVSVQIDILQGSATGTSVYTETLNTTTNFDGLLSLEVNAGEIDWANGPYFIQTTVEGNVISTVQLMAVPYAFYAAKAATDFSGKYEDLKNKPEIPVIPTKTSEYDNDVPYVTKEAQELSIDGDKLTISDGNTVDLPTANKVEYIPVNKPKTGDMLYWDNDKQEWVLIQGGKAGDVLAYFEKPEWAAMDEEGKITQKKESGCGTLVDIDGNEYQTTIIGKQCWMAENLRVRHYMANGTMKELTNTMTTSTATPYRVEINASDIPSHVTGVFPPDQPSQVFYSWYSATLGKDHASSDRGNKNFKIQGICPDGWHIPSYMDIVNLALSIDKNYCDINNLNNTTTNQLTSRWDNYQYANNGRSNDSLMALQLAHPDATWVSYPTTNSTCGPGTQKYGVGSTTPDSYTDGSYMCPRQAQCTTCTTSAPESWRWNERHFNAWPTGYVQQCNSSTVTPSSWTANGTLNFWTSYCHSTNSRKYVAKVPSNRSGLTCGSSNTTEFHARYSIRCVSDETFGE